MTIIIGNVLEVLPMMADKSVHCCVTSPPYWGLRDYGTAQWEGGDTECDHKPDRSGGIASSTLSGGKKTTNHQQEGYATTCAKCGARRIDSQLGLEQTPDEYVANMVAVFREVRRVLRDEVTLWLNLGDSYAGGAGGRGDSGNVICGVGTHKNKHDGKRIKRDSGPLKSKDLVGIPWRVAFALQADGWYLRSDIIWAKPNPMPESARDRPTKAHEYVFLMSKSERYWYDAAAVSEAMAPNVSPPGNRRPYDSGRPDGMTMRGNRVDEFLSQSTRNRRTVWTIATQPYKDAHFATYPEKLVEPCVLAGCPAKVCAVCGAGWERVVEVESHSNFSKDGQKHDGTYYRPNPGGGVSNDARAKRDLGHQPACTCNADTASGTVLDPFCGSGTTGAVAYRLGRQFVGIELNPEYAAMAERRIAPHRDQLQLLPA